MAEGALGMECPSVCPWGLCEGNLVGGSLAGDPDGHLEKALETGISFLAAPLLGNLEDGSSTGDFESWMKGLWGWGIALSRGSVEGTSGRTPFTRGTRKMRFLRVMQNAPRAGLPFIGDFWGT